MLITRTTPKLAARRLAEDLYALATRGRGLGASRHDRSPSAPSAPSAPARLLEGSGNLLVDFEVTDSVKLKLTVRLVQFFLVLCTVLCIFFVQSSFGVSLRWLESYS